MKVYAAKNKDLNIRLNSSSGGIFTLLAEQMIDEGGIVIGAAFEGLDVKHIAVSQKEDLSKLRGSKYVESTVDYSLLKTNRKILFSGTPCQIPINKKVEFDEFLNTWKLTYETQSYELFPILRKGELI